jgi:hypothetical protein
MDPKIWRAERNQLWRQRNMTLNVLMVIAIVALIWRNCF